MSVIRILLVFLQQFICSHAQKVIGVVVTIVDWNCLDLMKFD